MSGSSLRLRGSRRLNEVDMTPMVDVTFLLLIFFMVTATFSLQAAMDFRTPSLADASPLPVADEDEPRLVTMQVTADNEYRVTTADFDWVDVLSQRELRGVLAAAHSDTGETGRLLIIAHEDSLHRAVVQAMDIGTATGYDIQVKMGSDD